MNNPDLTSSIRSALFGLAVGDALGVPVEFKTRAMLQSHPVTDTTSAVTGGLAGLLYSFDSIPAEWMEQIARREDIEDLALRMADRLERG
jgi:ADP-ribosylglycohydrolase